MTENKRYTKEYFDVYNNEYDFVEEDIITIFDNVSNKKYFMKFIDDDEMNNTIDELINRLNEQEEQIQELLQDNEHKFWKIHFMHQFNVTSLIMHEIGLAIKEGYEVSDKFKEYLDEFKAQNEKGMKKANKQEKW